MSPFCDVLQDEILDVGAGEWSSFRMRKGAVYRKASTMKMVELTKRDRVNRRGMALSFAVVMVLILSFVGFGMLRLGMESRMRAVRTASEISARAAADAGLTKAVFEMNKNLGADWDFKDIESPRAKAFSSASADYTYTIEEVTKDAEYRITAVGKSGLASETVAADVVVQGIFDYAVYAQGYAIPKQPKPPKQDPPAPKPLKKGGKVEIKGYNVNGSYSSGGGAYSGPIQLRSNNVHKKSVKLREDVVVDGDIIVGPGGDPDKVIEMKDGASITGDAYPAMERQELLSVSVPKNLQVGVLKDYVYDKDKAITGNHRFSSFIIPKDKVQEISGNCEIYVDGGDAKVEDGAQLVLTPGSSLRLYVGGEKFEVKKKSDGLLNQTNDPTKLLIFGLDACRKVKIETEDVFHGAVYAPFAKVEMKTDADLYGAFVGWDVKLKKKKGESATFYFDRSLKMSNILAGDTLATRFVVRRWR